MIGTLPGGRTPATVDLPTKIARDEPTLAEAVGMKPLSLVLAPFLVAESPSLVDLPTPISEMGSMPVPLEGPSPTISLVSYIVFVILLSPLFPFPL